MAELTKKQLQAAEDRAADLSLSDDDVALQTADAMPERLGVKGEELDTAGSDQHGPVFSFTRKQVRQALEGWGERSSSGERSGGRRAEPVKDQGPTETGSKG